MTRIGIVASPLALAGLAVAKHHLKQQQPYPDPNVGGELATKFNLDRRRDYTPHEVASIETYQNIQANAREWKDNNVDNKFWAEQKDGEMVDAEKIGPLYRREYPDVYPANPKEVSMAFGPAAMLDHEGGWTPKSRSKARENPWAFEFGWQGEFRDRTREEETDITKKNLQLLSEHGYPLRPDNILLLAGAEKVENVFLHAAGYLSPGKYVLERSRGEDPNKFPRVWDCQAMIDALSEDGGKIKALEEKQFEIVKNMFRGIRLELGRVEDGVDENDVVIYMQQGRCNDKNMAKELSKKFDELFGDAPNQPHSCAIQFLMIILLILFIGFLVLILFACKRSHESNAKGAEGEDAAEAVNAEADGGESP